MPFNTTAEFEKSFPQVKNLTPEQKKKALDIFNGILEGDPEADEGRTVAIAISRSKSTNAQEKKVDETDPEKLKMDKDEKLYHIDEVELLADSNNSKIEILRTGKIDGRNLNITKPMLEDFVKHFNDNAYGTDIQVNLSHEREKEAGGWIKRLSIKDLGKISILLADVEWTPLGVEKIKSKQFRFTSSELSFSHTHFETKKTVKNVLIGVALTNIPAVKGMKAVTLSESAHSYISNHTNMDKLKQLHAFLTECESITSAQFKKFSEAADEAAKDASKEEVAEAEGMKKEVEAKVEEPKVDAPAEVTPEVKAELSEKNDVIAKLSEKLEATAKESKANKDKVELMELNEEVKDNLCLSEGELSSGFTPDKSTISKISQFMLDLSPEKRTEFKEILALYQTVDLSERGGNSKTDPVNGDFAEKMEKANEEAKKLSQESERPLGECLSEVYIKHGLDKLLDQ